MSIVLKIRMLSGENDDFVRDYELAGDASLLDLHYFICGDLGYDAASMASFFTSGRQWEKLEEFTLIDMGADDADSAPTAMESVRAMQVLRRNNDRLIYVFDPFSDRCMFIELTGSEKSDGTSGYPRVAFSDGEPPLQFDASTEADGAMFDDAMGEFSDFDGDDVYDDSY